MTNLSLSLPPPPRLKVNGRRGAAHTPVANASGEARGLRSRLVKLMATENIAPFAKWERANASVSGQG